ncbi:synaptonemal complex protein 1-like isoform X3 [Diospyros lotus]|uniref:synaptonemal complex protein 1-like isoform X3 n=1 Tax=Diospyros lotus TaxID=55363 RepID=UPI00225B61D3|nr:synaptonemal complex protein 1-like isoform X3 [Diospyros lotus]
MNKLTGLSSMKSLDHLKSLSGCAAGATKTYSISSRPSESIAYGSFANLKITAEKLIKEQASAKTDLEFAHSKLKKLTEHIHVLEEKLQNAFNENAKLKVKQKEDEKLWKGLESKFTSTKTLCDQLTETLQCLASQVQDAEKDKEFFEDNLSSNAAALDNFHDEIKTLSLRLESSEETARNREKELKEISIEKDEKEKYFRDEQGKAANLMKEKDDTIKNLEATVAANRLDIESLNSKGAELLFDLRSKEDDLKHLRISEETLEKEKSDLLSRNEHFAAKLEEALQEMKNLGGFANLMATKFNELDKQSLTFSDSAVQLISLYDSYFKLVQEEKHLASGCARKKYDQFHSQLLHITSEKDALQLVNQELNNKISELLRVQETVMVQHAEEGRLSEERIRRLESDAESLLSKKSVVELLVTKLEEKINTLSESLRLSENRMQDLLSKISALESESKDSKEKLQEEIQNKAEEVDILQREIEKYKNNVDLLDKQVSRLQTIVEEKEQLILQYKYREMQLQDHKAEADALLADTEGKLAEARKQYDLMVESKQLELSRHLKELSQKNDQAINDIRRKFEVEKMESINIEKEKADNAVQEIERKYDQKLSECKEESRQYLMRLQEEQAVLKITQLRNEHEVQLKAMRYQHEDECRKLQEELEIQKSKEDKQRALLQLQWRVMSDNPQEDQEVNSKKNNSALSTKTRNSDSGRRSQLAVVREKNDVEVSSPYVRATQEPVSNLLKKVEKVNTGSMMSIPKHSRKVTHHEYEVETSNGRTITKRRKTKSTVMFGDPRKHKRGTPRINNPRVSRKGTKGGNSHPSNIGDLFTEGSLNPYADDPYAFD